jgi:hypothetical protein
MLYKSKTSLPKPQATQLKETFLECQFLTSINVATYISDSCSKSVNTAPEHYDHQTRSTCAQMLPAHDPIYNTIIQNSPTDVLGFRTLFTFLIRV